MSWPEWIVDQISPRDPEARERSDRRFFFWVTLPLTAGTALWKAWHWLTASG
jgi:hypothetical protein